MWHCHTDQPTLGKLIITTNKTYIPYLRAINLLNILYLKLDIYGIEAQEAAKQSLTIQLTI